MSHGPTQHVPGLIALIRRLIEKDYAYADANGGRDVCSREVRGLRLSSSGQNTSRDLRAGARIDVDEFKRRDPLDFVLWNMPSPASPSGKSPWGPGRPRGHIACRRCPRS